jgi:hypothetical protein
VTGAWACQQRDGSVRGNDGNDVYVDEMDEHGYQYQCERHNLSIAEARQLGQGTPRGGRYSRRVCAVRIDSASRTGRIPMTAAGMPKVAPIVFGRIVRLTTEESPAGHTHWSCRTMAKHVGVSHSAVQRIWFDLGIKPHRVDTFKVSTDVRFEEKLADVVGLYLNPPEKAIVLCMDEKSQIQALDRTQASLPMVRGRAATMTHDYKRNGTTTLFAALDVLTGTAIGQCLSPAPPKRVNQILEHHQQRGARRAAGPSDPGQLQHPQARRRPAMVAPAQAISPALHANLVLVAQPGGTLVP